MKGFFDFNIAKEAIGFIKETVKDDIVFIGFSGGKDSIVTTELVRRSGVMYNLYYSFTGIDAPEVVRFIRKNYKECKFLMPKRTFWHDLKTHTPPSDRLRWCCSSLKKEAANKLPHKKRIMGIRSEEGAKRAKRPRINYFKKLNQTHYYPILNWKEYEIWEFIEKNKLPYPVLYDWGFNRIGCVVCPYHSEKTGKLHKMYRDRWSKYFKRFEKGIIDLYYKRVSQGKEMFYKTPEEFLKNWYIDDASRWYADSKIYRKDKLRLF